ncbi:hypothetical protein IAU59_003351 [Kwoniella sp. CBS 9459]
MRSISTFIVLGLVPSALCLPTTLTPVSASFADDITTIAYDISQHTTTAMEYPDQGQSQTPVLAANENQRRAGMDDYLWLSSSVDSQITTAPPSSAEPTQVTDHHDRHELAQNLSQTVEARSGAEERGENAQDPRSKDSSEETSTAVVKERTKVWRRRAWRRRAHP